MQSYHIYSVKYGLSILSHQWLKWHQEIYDVAIVTIIPSFQMTSDIYSSTLRIRSSLPHTMACGFS
jgi:hypothetical protein